jgi:hypothetical protein
MITVTHRSRVISVSSKRRTFLRRSSVANRPSEPVLLCGRMRAIVGQRPKSLSPAQWHSIALSGPSSR